MKRTCVALLIAAVGFIYGYLIGHNVGYNEAANTYTETYEGIIDRYKQVYESAIDELFKTTREQHRNERSNQEHSPQVGMQPRVGA